MGRMRFVVTPPQRLTPETIEQAYLSGVDRAGESEARLPVLQTLDDILGVRWFREGGIVVGKRREQDGEAAEVNAQL